jgi:hypothetical protein
LKSVKTSKRNAKQAKRRAKRRTEQGPLELSRKDELLKRIGFERAKRHYLEAERSRLEREKAQAEEIRRENLLKARGK